ncbi:MAG TPA: PASTA domain-containing protein, partial [Tenericutes bacterium]|nr:PASTA domain-containing protein [Mycoplasmatota bacterium]
INLLNNIENFIRRIGIIVIIIGAIILTIEIYKTLTENRKLKAFNIATFTIIYSVVAIFLSYNIDKIYSTLSDVSTKTSKYSTSIVTLVKNDVDNIENIGSSDIGIINDESSIIGYQTPKYIMEKNKLKNNLVYYDSFTDLIEQLFKEEIEYIFLPTNYKILFNNIEGFDYNLDQTKIIYSEEKVIEIEKNEVTKKISEPFTLLLMGVDSEKENIKDSSFNGDALMLITFNPETLNATILSIPRDTYVPITCFAGKRENKITHAAWYGEDCMMDTIENFTGIKIDYYVKINFKGVVKVVDSIGGIYVDVPYSFCEQDSNRRFGKHTIYVEKGYRKINGEQALALSRNRKPNSEYCTKEWTYGSRNDFIRGSNQQLVVKGLLSQLKNINSLNKVYDLLDTIKDNMETNMSIDEILSFYNIGKDILIKSKNSDINDAVKLQTLYLSGYSKTIFDTSMKLPLYNYVPYQGSIDDIVHAMNVNLGIKEPKIIKSLNFDINEPYKEKVIGQGYYKDSEIKLLPDFIGKDISQAIEYFKENGINLDIEYVTSTDGNDFVGKIINQSLSSGIHIKYINKSSGIKIKAIEKVNIPIEDFDYSLCILEENSQKSNCLLKNYVGKTVDELKTFIRKTKLSILIEEIEIDENDKLYDEKYIGYIVEQSVDENTPLKDLINKTIKIKYIKETQIPEDPGNITTPDNNPIDIPYNPIDDIIPNSEDNNMIQ